MPCYEYHCQACGKDFERIMPIDERDYPCCPFCWADRRLLHMAQRKLSVFSFQFPQIKSVSVNGERVA